MRYNAWCIRARVLTAAALVASFQLPVSSQPGQSDQELLNKTIAAPQPVSVDTLLTDWSASQPATQSRAQPTSPSASQSASMAPAAGALAESPERSPSAAMPEAASTAPVWNGSSAVAAVAAPAPQTVSSPGQVTVTQPATVNVNSDKNHSTALSGGQSNIIHLKPDSVLSFLDPVNASCDGAPVVIDNDEAEETSATIQYEDLPTDEGKTHVKTGASFPVVITSEITSKTAKLNDPVQARLKYDLKIGDRLIAPKGSPVAGHLNYVLKARTALHSLVSPERWYRNSGTLGIAFDEIINDKGEHLPLKAHPGRQARVIKNKGEGRELGVNHHGQVTGPWSQQLKYKAVRIGLNAALSPVGAFSFGAMPVALGVMGAACPSFAFMKPVGTNVRHRRLKGFAWGFLSGIPGSWLIEDTTVKGQEAVIKPGDEFLVEFEQEFTGEPATEAELMPNATTKVRGQIVDTKHSKKKGK